MKDVDEETPEQVVIDVEKVAYHLLLAYPNIKYVVLNTGLTVVNQDAWHDHWYFAGFPDMPVYQNLDGYPAWVYDKSVTRSQDEWAVFFMHISSKDHFFKGQPIQNSRTEFMSPRHFCWKIGKGKKLEQIEVEEIAPPENDTKQLVNDLKDMFETTLLKPAVDALKPKGGDDWK